MACTAAIALAVLTPSVAATQVVNGAAGPSDAATRAATRRPVYSGRRHDLQVRIPRLDGAVVVDGVLDEPQWQSAALLTGFSQFAPADGIAADDSMEVLVWYSATAIHFGIRAFEAHGPVHATLANRDKIDSDDYVQLLLGTFNDGRQAMLFGVNPLGVQQDGIITETGANRGGSGFTTAGSIREAPDLNPDFVFRSKGIVTDFGYQVEITIPFKTLRFQPSDEQSWGMQVIRKVQHNGHEEVWAPALRASASFLAQSGRLVGLHELRRGLVLDLTPEVYDHADGAPGATGAWQYSTSRPDVGATMRWGVSENMTFTGTVKPDFSQVEADVIALSTDPRRAVSYPEKRPFFLEGTEQFNVPSSLIYTRDLVQPDAAVKITGKAEGTNIAYLSALDGRSYSLDHAQPFYNILRVQHDFGASSRLGIAYTDVEDGRTYNRVADVDARIVWDRIYSVQLQYAQSFDRTSGVTTTDPLWSARIDRNGHNLSLRYQVNAIGDNFVTRSGFVARGGIGHMNLGSRYTFFGAKGALLESIAPDASLDLTYTYHNFVRNQGLQDLKWHFGLTGAFRGGWSVNAALLVETFGYDSTLYPGYRIEVPRPGGGLDTIPFTGTPHLPNVDLQLTASTPQTKYWDAQLSFIGGKDENFYEWSNGNVLVATLTVNLRPSEKFRINAIWKENKYWRRTDNSVVGDVRVPRLKVEYQLTREIYFRYVGQFSATYADSLRDDSRTNDPLLACATGACHRIAMVNSNSLRNDYLFSYSPVPGTVLFVGYGGTQVGDRPITLDGLHRTTDGFFVKGSYLLRM